MSENYTDGDRLAFLAGCGGDDGPIVEGFASVDDDFYDFACDAARDRVGEEEYYKDDFEISDQDKLEGFRRLVDAAMDADAKRKAVGRERNQ